MQLKINQYFTALVQFQLLHILCIADNPWSISQHQLVKKINLLKTIHAYQQKTLVNISISHTQGIKTKVNLYA